MMLWYNMKQKYDTGSLQTEPGPPQQKDLGIHLLHIQIYDCRANHTRDTAKHYLPISSHILCSILDTKDFSYVYMFHTWAR